jgi:hypothetical protein
MIGNVAPAAKLRMMRILDDVSFFGGVGCRVHTLSAHTLGLICRIYNLTLPTHPLTTYKHILYLNLIK